MKNRIYLIIILCILFLSIKQPIYSQEQIIIQTPNCTDVPAWINFPPLTSVQIQQWYDYMAVEYPYAEILAPPSAQYACHGYAWHTSETGQEVIIAESGAQIYFSQEDMSYLEVEEPWIEDYWNDVEKIYYSTLGNEHSAIYHSGTYYEPIYDSKWNDGPLVRHDETDCPYFVNFNDIKYYKPNNGTSIEEHLLSFEGNLLIANHPNPFNPSTTISYSLSDNIQNPQIEIYNVKGQKVKSYQLEETIGESSIVWNGKDLNNKSVSSGVYFYQLLNDDKIVQTRKMLMLK